MTAELPIARVTSVTRSLRAAVAVTASPFTGTQQVHDWGGSWWDYEIEFAALQDADGRRLSAFLAALRGGAATFTFRDPFIRNGVVSASPLVQGSGQTGTSLITDGWAAAGLRAGDFFSLGTGTALRLHQLTADVVPSGGAATLQFVPALRSSPADNAPLEVVRPAVLLRVNGVVPVQIGLADLYRFSLSAREAI